MFESNGLALAAGFSLGLSLIMAIGAQNAFILRQGLRREHVFAVCLTCALSDAILILAGVAGFGYLVEAAPWIGPAMTYGGAVFLIVYGAFSARRALSSAVALEASETKAASLWRALLTCLALTWLNPHVYLDTVVLLGSISTRYDARALFGLGAVIASFFFFFSLGYGARILAPLFAKPIAWRILDGLVALVMWVIATKLIFS
ncbi:LysE/ArgO family amino acid transporter [Ovoidimarina sediminis]|uniref:LysE/ArgO family amino acid transporter n=1 Tax=Ovoidimarina sediminis TaxID=3079856 RepID=UPI0029112D16|nr:LysE/ArgO family amino acid transporter [Rhodophyticola sp. MJ-SS7]MDU8945095.1 LysE/ArgO family amino acid transporter [Rhodophyticola sp. MJ-SS7]